MHRIPSCSDVVERTSRVLFGTLMALVLACFGCRDAVSPPAVDRIIVEPDSILLDEVGATRKLVAEVLDAEGRTLDLAVTWRSTNPLVATVDDDGLVTAVASGTARIAVQSAERGTSAAVTVAITLVLESISVGLHHTCGLESDGTAWCWGRNDEGESGDGTTLRRFNPVRVATDLRFVQLSAGAYQSCALTAEGIAYCWGWNLYGELGVGDEDRRLVPTRVAGDERFERLDAGNVVTCGLTSEGVALCWGSNGDGQLGGTVDQRCARISEYCANTPRLVPTELRFASIVSGSGHACGLDAVGRAYCWGSNTEGELGDGTLERASLPTFVVGGLTFASIALGWHTCGLTPAGDAWCWGSNGAGELGVETAPETCPFIGCSTRPVAVDTDLKFSSIQAGGGHTCALTTEGRAYCWGYGGEGQLGDGIISYFKATPEPVLGDLRFQQLSIGWFHTCGLTTEGKAYCWGSNAEGGLGNGSWAIALTPSPVVRP